jgi:hypothetical protein
MGIDESSLYKFNANGTVEVTENSGKINLKTVNSALSTVTGEIGAIFGHDGVATKRELQPEAKNDAYAMMNLLKSLGVNVYGEATEGELYYDGLSESVKFKRPTTTGGTGVGGGAGTIVVAAPEKKKETYTSMADKFKTIPYSNKMSISDEKKLLFPYGKVGKTGFEDGVVNKILEASDYGKNPLTQEQLLKITGFENIGVLKDAAMSYFTTKGGDLAHMIAQTPEDVESINKFVHFLNSFAQSLESVDINFRPEVLQHIGENFDDLVSIYG